MSIKGIIFDLYGTLIDIETDESMDEIYRAIAHYLTYHGVNLHRWGVRERYQQIMTQQKEARGEDYPEIDVEAIWNTLLWQEGIERAPTRRRLARVLAQLYRGISRKRLQLYPEVRRTLDALRPAYRLAVVSDAQPCFAVPEMRAMGLAGYFQPIVISARYGYRKPDRRLFEKALAMMRLAPHEVLHVGNDMFRDIHGAQGLGIRSIFVESNQGASSHADTRPDRVAAGFGQVLEAVASLADADSAPCRQ
ncbi:MAG: HAD family hydrolase [Burkholderiales bacterium]|nr:HAD family hydrolase [Burkholderiales bacterium]OJX05298.1 MAG: HAD family hydrolase [Burkholderiales bacterium 70-64]